MNERVSVYYKTPTIHLDNIPVIILQTTINLLCQGRGKCLQLPQLNTHLSLYLLRSSIIKLKLYSRKEGGVPRIV